MVSRQPKVKAELLSIQPYRRWRRDTLSLYLMLVPGVILTIIFCYVPMGGITIAFQQFIPAKGLFGDQQWIGLDNFRYVMRMPEAFIALKNTLVISGIKMVMGLLVPITFSLLLNEVKNNGFKRTVQTLTYLPHFLSWVVLGGVLITVLSPNSGAVNQLLMAVGIDPIFFLGSNKWFRFTLVFTDVWKEFGFNSIVFLSAMTSIDPQLYDAAEIDGAGRWNKVRYVTLPGITMMIVLMGVLKLGSLLNAGFDQVFNLYSPSVYQTGDILDTLVYRMGIEQAQFGVSTAVGLFKSVVSTILISTSYFMAYKFADYRIF